jgi:hypothetical protein
MIDPGLTVNAMRTGQVRLIFLVTLCLLAALPAGVLAGMLSSGSHEVALVAFFGLAALVALWRWPHAGPLLMLLAATLIEQFGLPRVGFHVPSDQVPFFTSLSDGVGLKGIYVNPAEVTLALIVLAWLARAVGDRTLEISKSTLAGGLLVLSIVVALALARGLSRGGDVRAMLWEVRPWFYLVTGYVIASQLLVNRRHVRALLWVIVIGTGAKGVEGTVRFLTTLQVQPRPDALLGHEESLFFGVFLLLPAALWLFKQRGALRRVATALVPVILVADLSNMRRAAWLILFVGLAVLVLVVWVRYPERRPAMKKAVVVGAILFGLYVGAFWNSAGVLGQPARAIRSGISPDPRDKQSNLYRQQEDANLVLNILRVRSSTLVGQGFGIPIDYAITIDNVSNIDPFIAYVPHDGILYLWLRMGVPGVLAFWFFAGTAVVSACRVARCADPELAVYGAVVASSLVGYLMLAHDDMGLFWFRVALLMGILLGGLEVVRRVGGDDLMAIPDTQDDAWRRSEIRARAVTRALTAGDRRR